MLQQTGFVLLLPDGPRAPIGFLMHLVNRERGASGQADQIHTDQVFIHIC
jgi:hypothetical protein